MKFHGFYLELRKIDNDEYNYVVNFDQRTTVLSRYTSLVDVIEYAERFAKEEREERIQEAHNYAGLGNAAQLSNDIEKQRAETVNPDDEVPF